MMQSEKHSVLWTFYHTVLAIELALVVLIEGTELYLNFFELWP